MSRLEIGERIAAAGSENAVLVSALGEGIGLFVDSPAANVILQRGRNEFDIVAEALSGVAHRPSACIFEALRQVPVIKRRGRSDPGTQARVGDSLVIVEALGIGRAAPVGLYTRPSD